MAKKRLTAKEEYELYRDNPELLIPQGPPVRRKPKMTEMVPVRFPAETLKAVQKLADADDRSVSSWIRRAVENELARQSAKR